MQNIFQQGMFSIDPGSSPDALEKKRQQIRDLISGNGQTRYVGEGLTKLATGIAGGMQNRRMNQIEGDNREEATNLFNGLFGGGAPSTSTRSAPVTPPSTALQSPQVTTGPIPDTPQAIGQDTRAALGLPSDTSFVRYSNQGATRNQPLVPELVGAMGFLGDMGITMDVVSGGQDGKGEGDRRTGSTRHDHGNAADVDFYMNGRRLTTENPDDIPILTEIVRRAKANGLTGFGEGADYMGAGRLHIGYGNPSVWGAGGRSANAPEWLQQAYHYEGDGHNHGGQAPAPQAPQGPSMGALMQAIQNPWLSNDQKAVVQTMLQQQQQASDPLRQLQIQQAQVNLDQSRNPAPEGPTSTLGKFYADQRAGLIPADAQPPQSGTNVTVNNGAESSRWGDAPKDHVWLYDQNGEIVTEGDPSGRGVRPVAVPISGGPDDTSGAEGVRLSNATTASDIVTTSAQRAREAANSRQVGGLAGRMASNNPASENAELYRQVEVLKSNAKIENLNAMRAASPTGGALGSVTERETQMLAERSGALDPASPNFLRDLDDYERTLLRVIHGQELGDQIFDQTRAAGGPNDDDLLKKYGG